MKKKYEKIVSIPDDAVQMDTKDMLKILEEHCGEYYINDLPDFDFDINGKKISYSGNPVLKSINTELETDARHMLEILKCSDDIMYFAENYFFIVHLDLGKIRIPLRDYQKSTIKTIMENRWIQLLFPRQSGKCISKNSTIRVRNRTTDVIVETTIGEFYSDSIVK